VEKDGTSAMSKQQQAPSSQNDRVPWWIRLCRWLWKASGFLGVSVFLALGVNIASTWLTTPKGPPADTPLSVLIKNWPISLLVGCCLFLLAIIFWAVSRWNVPSSTISAAITPQDRERMLRRLRVRYEQSLAQSLQGAVQIELGLASRPAAIQNALSLSLRLPEQPEHVLPAHTSIVDVYNQAQQELLILGKPGAGKSTLLLKLAHHLVEQAGQNAEQPLPILLPLSSWAVKRPALQDWLIDQIKSIYDVPRQLSQDWVRADLILPLLDGLDEMDEAARAACIAAINTYHGEHLQPLVICSRTHEYDAATVHEQLALHTAVVVQPLTLEQINVHLTTIGKPLIALRMALKKNTMLQTLATTPLLLQILMLTYHGISVRALSHNEVQLREQIWSDYVQQMVSHKGDSKCYPLEQTRAWLGWLARQMQLQNQTIFSLERLQPNWLPKRRRTIYQWSVRLLVCLLFVLSSVLFFGLLPELLSGLLFGPLPELLPELLSGLHVGLLAGLLFEPLSGLLSVLSGKKFTERLLFSPNERIQRFMKNGLLVGLLSGLFTGLLVGPYLGPVAVLFFGLLFGLFSGLFSEPSTTIQPAEALIWSWKGLLSGLLLGLALGPLVGLVLGLLAGLVLGPHTWLLPWLLSGLLFGLFSGLLAGLSGRQLTERFLFSPNEGIQRSIKNGLLVGLLFGLLAGLVLGPLVGLLVGPVAGLFFGLFAGLLAGLCAGLCAGLLFGLLAVAQHYTLRFWLWRSHLFPWKAVPFLEDATARILLQRVGGGYSFTHRLLLDYFADLKTPPPAPSINAHLVQPPPSP
jgi:NACHT domain